LAINAAASALEKRRVEVIAQAFCLAAYKSSSFDKICYAPPPSWWQWTADDEIISELDLLKTEVAIELGLEDVLWRVHLFDRLGAEDMLVIDAAILRGFRSEIPPGAQPFPRVKMAVGGKLGAVVREGQEGESTGAGVEDLGDEEADDDGVSEGQHQHVVSRGTREERIIRVQRMLEEHWFVGRAPRWGDRRRRHIYGRIARSLFMPHRMWKHLVYKVRQTTNEGSQTRVYNLQCLVDSVAVDNVM
jgi:hypothetical protein